MLGIGLLPGSHGGTGGLVRRRDRRSERELYIRPKHGLALDVKQSAFGRGQAAPARGKLDGRADDRIAADDIAEGDRG